MRERPPRGVRGERAPDTVKAAQQSRPEQRARAERARHSRAPSRAARRPLGLFKGLSAPLVGYSSRLASTTAPTARASVARRQRPVGGTPATPGPLSSELFEAAARRALGGLLLSVAAPPPTDPIH